MLFFDLDRSEIKTLFVFLYHILHLSNGLVEVYFLEGDADRRFGKMKNLLSEFDIIYVT